MNINKWFMVIYFKMQGLVHLHKFMVPNIVSSWSIVKEHVLEVPYSSSVVTWEVGQHVHETIMVLSITIIKIYPCMCWSPYTCVIYINNSGMH